MPELVADLVKGNAARESERCGRVAQGMGMDARESSRTTALPDDIVDPGDVHRRGNRRERIGLTDGGRTDQGGAVAFAPGPAISGLPPDSTVLADEPFFVEQHVEVRTNANHCHYPKVTCIAT